MYNIKYLPMSFKLCFLIFQLRITCKFFLGVLYSSDIFDVHLGGTEFREIR